VDSKEIAVSQIMQEILDSKGKVLGSLKLDDEVFGAEVAAGVVHSVVRWQRAKRRAGTASALNRAAKSGGGKKPWKQKGTGNARAGSSNSPVWVGGAVAHGPQPRKYDFKLPKGVRRKALVSVLSDKLKKGNLLVVDEINVSGKTKDLVAVLKGVGVQGVKTLILMPEKVQSVWQAAGNIEGVQMLPVAGLNVYDILNARKVIATKAAVAAIEQRLSAASQAEVG
jgi:large subunit ribosomal protein L4